jgi:hypothetical protein
VEILKYLGDDDRKHVLDGALLELSRLSKRQVGAPLCGRYLATGGNKTPANGVGGAKSIAEDATNVAGRRGYAERPAFTLNQRVDQGGAPSFGLPPSINF